MSNSTKEYILLKMVFEELIFNFICVQKLTILIGGGIHGKI